MTRQLHDNELQTEGLGGTLTSPIFENNRDFFAENSGTNTINASRYPLDSIMDLQGFAHMKLVGRILGTIVGNSRQTQRR